MSLPQIVLLSMSEIIGDFGFKRYANKGGIVSFSIGSIGYFGVICMLIVSLRGSTILMVNSSWDGISALLESIAAYVILGERFDDPWQYVGILFIITGLFLLNIPLTR